MSDYAKRTRGPTVNPRGIREDFAITFGLFIRDPGVLFAASRKRFEYMIGLFTDHTPTDKKEDFGRHIMLKAVASLLSMKESGTSIEKLLEIYGIKRITTSRLENSEWVEYPD